MGTEPLLFIADPELIKQVLIKDFSHFINRANPPTYHEYISQTLLLAKDEQWRRLRTITSPAFTSGKLRGMHHLISKCINKLENYLDRLIDQGGVMNTREVVRGFTIDVIASTSFATETNANDDRTDQDRDPLVINAKKMFEFNPARMIALFTLPKFVLDLFGITSFFEPKPLDFFVDLSKHILKARKSQIQTVKNRTDLVQLMLDASVDESELDNDDYDKLIANEKDEVDSIKEEMDLKSKRKTLTESEIIANCIIFFVAGFETTSATISHCIFELAHHPIVQDRLYAEIMASVEQFDDRQDSGKYFDTVLTAIPYLEAVIKETLRRYPPVMLISRVCNTDNYQLGSIRLDRNRIVAIPINAVHNDPEFYPDPTIFNPDRFMPENRHRLTPYTNLAFAAGPRNCAGMRFAYQEVKLCLAQLVQRYRFAPTPSTPTKPQFVKGISLLNSLPFPIKVYQRTK